MKRHLLIPTDFSENSWNALKYALSIFRNEYCNFHLLHVCNANGLIDPEMATMYVSQTVAVEKDVRTEAKAKLKELVRKIDLDFRTPKHNFITHVACGFLIECIREKVIENEIDLIIMGTKGASGLKEAIVGSNTGDVITRVKCPVLVIPELAKYQTPKEIAFPTDFGMYYSSKVLETFLDVSKIHDSAVRIVHISKKENFLSQEQERNKELLDDYFKDTKHSFHNLQSSHMDTALDVFTSRKKIDLIAMVAKNLNYFQQLLFKPLVKDLSYHVKLPLLVLHE